MSSSLMRRLGSYKMARPLSTSILLAFAFLLAHARAGDAPSTDPKFAFFESKIRPVLVEACYKCHSAESDKIKGGLRVDFRDGLLKGGVTGPAVVPGDLEKSLLIKAIRHTDDELAMPKKKLPPEQIADFEKWVQSGAPDPREKAAPVARAAAGIDFEKARKFWSFQPPPEKLSIPKVELKPGWEANPVDAFIAAKLKEKGLAPGTTAEKRTLIRRATYDLTGLPPSPEEIDAFLADSSPDAYSKVVERLLASPRYGERWGRHWLDVARYADTAGDNSDFPIPQAYRYRDYVIQSFNQDKPYDQFIREQIAGDLLPSKSEDERRQSVIATGFLALSRRFGSSRAEQPVHLTIEDTIDTMGRSVMGLSLSCSRCHDHKFDPITMSDYYGLYGIFESTRYPFPGAEEGNRPMDLVPLGGSAFEQKRKEFQNSLAPFEAELIKVTASKQALEKEMKSWADQKRVLATGGFENGGRQTFSAGQGGADLGRVDIKAGEMLELQVLPKLTHGGDTTVVVLEITELEGQKRTWNLTRDVLADFEKIGKENPHKDAYGNKSWYFYDALNGFDLFNTFVPDAFQQKGIHAWKNGEDTPLAVVNLNEKTSIFQTVTFPPRAFAIHPSPKGPVAVGWESLVSGTIQIKGEVIDADEKVGDGIAWALHIRPGISSNVGRMKEIGDHFAKAKAKLDAEVGKAPVMELAYAVAEAKAANAHIQKRGDPKNPGDEAPRRFPQLLGGQTLPKEESGSGRLELAQWMTEPNNPLTARVIVNRIWQHHFGKGLVATPNDFGTRGTAPTHPELLDYLARRFIQDGWSIKKLHRLIMSSQTYRLTSADDPKNAAVDPSNDWLWKYSRQRLDAECIRDAMLDVSGTLQPAPTGPHPFPPENTWSFTQHAPFTAVYESKSRSVYLMQQRIKKHPFLALFDGADPNTTTGSRLISTTPIQALFMMNDPFVHESAAKFAARVMQAKPAAPARIELAYRLAVGRVPSSMELTACEEYLKKYTEKLGASVPAPEAEQRSWTSLARALLSSNEFIFVD